MGDIGQVDADNFVTLMGRSKDMIISGGFDIYPRDLEEALMAHADLVDTTFIGVESRNWGETPIGFVVSKDGNSRNSTKFYQQPMPDWAKRSAFMPSTSYRNCCAVTLASS